MTMRKIDHYWQDLIVLLKSEDMEVKFLAGVLVCQIAMTTSHEVLTGHNLIFEDFFHVNQLMRFFALKIIPNLIIEEYESLTVNIITQVKFGSTEIIKRLCLIGLYKIANSNKKNLKSLRFLIRQHLKDSLDVCGLALGLLFYVD